MIFQDYKIDAIDRGVRLPDFKIDQIHKTTYNLDEEVSHGHFLYVLAVDGLGKRGITTKHPRYKEYSERLKYELSVLDELGFSQYLLTTWDIVRFCRESKIATGWGRGSGAGSLVLYLVQVTEVDPIEHNLFFERFLSKTRAKFKIFDGVKYYDGSLLMDIDIDIAHNLRDKVVSYVENRYGGQVSKILTVSTFTTKVLVKEVAKAVIDDFQEKDAKIVSDSVPVLHGKVYSLKESLEESQGFKDFMDRNPKVLRICKKIEGLIKHTGSHASAIIICPGKLHESLPTQRVIDKESGLPIKVTGYDMSDVLNVVVKIDLLGLKAATLISETCKKIGKFTPFEIPLHDKTIYDSLQNFRASYGIFQIDGDCAHGAIRSVKPKLLSDLSAVLALARPGAMVHIPNFSKAVNLGEKQSLHPFLDDVLQDGRGLVIYQEQTLAALKKIGFTGEEAEIARRIIGKKDLEAVKNWEQKIKDKVKENGIPEEVGNILWDTMSQSASYSFNKSLFGGTIVNTPHGDKRISEIKVGDRVKAFDVDQRRNHSVEVLNVHEHDVELFQFKLSDGKHIICSMDHKFLATADGYNEVMLPIKSILRYCCHICGEDEEGVARSFKIADCPESLGVQKSYDLEVDHKDHNFYANGLKTSNSHSLSYACCTAACLYLQTNYPKEFFLTCLEMATKTEDIQQIQSESRQFNVSIRGPHIIESDDNFAVKGNTIYFGLGSIKGVSGANVSKLTRFRRNFTNKFEIFSSAKECGIGIGVLANLIYVGCLDDFLTETRSKTVLEACCWNLLTEKEKIECLKRGPDFQFNLFKLIKALNETIKTEKGKPVIKDSRRDTLRKKMADYLEIYKNNSKHEDFTVFEMESRLLGFSYSQTLQNVYKKLEPNLEEIEVVKSYGPKEQVIFVGKVKFAAEGLTKKAGMPYFRCVVADHTAEITCFLYENDRYPGISQHKELNGRLAAEGDVVVVRGQRSGDDIVNANNIAVQEVKVFAKASELPDKEEKDETNIESAPKT